MVQYSTVQYSTVQCSSNKNLFIYVILDMFHNSYTTRKISAGCTQTAYRHEQHNTQ